MNDQRTDSPVVSKVIRLVDYLARLALLRTKLIRDIAKYEKVLWFSNIPHERGCFTQAWGRDEEHGADDWLEIQNRREPELPSVPSQCKDWVNESTLRNKSELPELFSEITQEVQNPDWREGSDQSETIPHTERLEEHPEAQEAWNRYIENKWLPWTEEHHVWEKVHQVYSILFAIHHEQLRLGEEYELVLGIGLLTWQTPTGQHVRRHLIVADAILEFEARLGKFIVRPYTEGTKLRPELDMLDIEEQPTRAEETMKSSLAQAEDDPWEKGCIEGVLKAMVNSISSQSDYDDCLEAKNIHISEKPIIEFAPALILRKRSAKGLTETLKRIKERIEEGGNIPCEFADLAEIRTVSDREPADNLEESNQIFDGEIFFPKPSNDEQRRIVDKIRSASGVLVQGPPGTGKSHTIANLICHLLATGNRILVTAKTPRALQVLLGKICYSTDGKRDKKTDNGLIPEEIKPLCINLLGSGNEERRSLESSVGGILRRYEEWNEERAQKERIRYEEQLRKLREEKTRINLRLRDIRESETHSRSIAHGTYRGTAARIAEAVNRDKPIFEWFTDIIPLDKTCPLSESSLLNILTELRYFTLERRRELSLVWPETFPSSERFASLVGNEEMANQIEHGLKNESDECIADLLSRSNTSTIEEICRVFSAFQAARKNLMASPYTWTGNALRDVCGGNSTLWRELSRATRSSIASIETLVAIVDDTSVEFPDITNVRSLREDARKLKEFMENGGKLGWGPFRAKEVKERLYVIKIVRIDGHTCSTIEHFSILCDVLHVRIECEKAWGFWVGRSDKTQGPYVLQMAALKSLCDTLVNILSVNGLIDECREALRQCPAIGESIWADESQTERLIASCRLALARHDKQLAYEELRAIEIPVESIVNTRNAHPFTNKLLGTIYDRDIDGFSQAANEVRNLEKERQRLQKMDDVISKLYHLLPRLTDELMQTYDASYWDGRLQHISDAWHWEQARYWVEEYIQQEDFPALAKRAKQIEDEINVTIATLASLHAWAFCFSRLKEDHRRHMEAWQQSMRRLGKGTGMHAPRHRREAQEHLNKCREAVPAWVMPLHRVWDTVDPAPGMFNVVIIDEASQCGVEALPLFYLGEKILIVGDDKQISPDAVGLPRDAVHRLMEEHLHDFHFKSSFDVESSLFDHGKLRYGTRRITLREHFRCMPEIIRFSNELCYFDTPLIPLRQYGPNRLAPLEHIFVSGGYREGSSNRTINRPEAEAIAGKIVELCNNPRYDEKTMGVIVLQGEAQASEIERLLLEKLGSEEMERRRLVCGNPYSFQGDERHIIFLSMVAAPDMHGQFREGPTDEKRYNVAMSRSCDQVWLFHSITYNDLSRAYLRRELLEFFENMRPYEIAGIDRDELERRASQDNRGIVNPPTPFGSWFEVDVALELARKDYEVLPQYEFAGRRIDLVIQDGPRKLAVECDGDRWHGPDKYEEDMQRQRQLERCNWEFFRVRESAFYANRSDALSGLWQALEERDIFPTTWGVDKFDEGDTEEGKECESEVGENEDIHEDKYYDSEESDDGVNPSGRRAEEISTAEIQEAILQALSKLPNQSCTLHSLTSRVLREVEVLTRGNPRAEFEKRVMRSVNILEKHEHIEKYKAKNRRIRLVRETA